MTFVLGLTGSIGTGKSTTAGMFRAQGIPVWDADAEVHSLYAPNGAATRQIEQLMPEVILEGAVSRKLLREKIVSDPAILDVLQTIIRPLLAESRARFLATQSASIVLLDVPLLYEIGLDAQCDAVVVVSIAPDIQKKRVLDRGEMNEAQFETILARQMPDAEKRSRAAWVIETTGLEATRGDVAKILSQIRERLALA